MCEALKKYETLLKTNFWAADDYLKEDPQEIKRFKVSTKYGTSSVCDHNCIFKFTITKRTEKSIWFFERDPKKVTRRKLDIWEGEETFRPYGTYSMAPVLSATDLI